MPFFTVSSSLKRRFYAGLGDVGVLVVATYSYLADRFRFKSMKVH